VFGFGPGRFRGTGQNLAATLVVYAKVSAFRFVQHPLESAAPQFPFVRTISAPNVPVHASEPVLFLVLGYNW